MKYLTQLRTLIAEYLLNLALTVMPDGKDKIYLSTAINWYIKKVKVKKGETNVITKL